MEIKITIPGKPVAKHRPKFARRGKFVTVYNDQGTEEGRALLDIRRQWTIPPLTGPVNMMMRCVFPWPKSLSAKKRASFPPHLTKPDCSNILKFYEDLMNSWVYKDDSQIVDVRVSKKYGDDPRTEIFITWWEAKK